MSDPQSTSRPPEQSPPPATPPVVAFLRRWPEGTRVRYRPASRPSGHPPLEGRVASTGPSPRPWGDVIPVRPEGAAEGAPAEWVPVSRVRARVRARPFARLALHPVKRGRLLLGELGEASAIACARRGARVRGLGASFCTHASGKGGTLELLAGPFHLSLGASATRCRWRTGVVDPASMGRQVLVVATRKHFLWRFDRPFRPLQRGVPSTLREGSVEWARLFLGALITEDLPSTTSRGLLPLAEGTYEVDLRQRTKRCRRARLPLVSWLRHRMQVEVEEGIAMPFAPRVPGGPVTEGLLYRFDAPGALDAETALQEVARRIRRDRRRAGGRGWRPALRVRAAKTDGAEPAAEGAPIAWERRDPLTGQWSAWETRRREDLPEGAIVQTWPGGMNWLAAGLGLSLLGGLAGMAFSGASTYLTRRRGPSAPARP